MLWRYWHAATVFCVSMLCGCAGLLGCAGVMPVGHSPLTQPRMHADSVVLDLSFVRFPFGQAELNEALWSQIDEQVLPAAVRRRWEEQGLRAGILSGSLPAALARLLEPVTAARPPAGENQVDLTRDEVVTTRHVQARAGQRVELSASPVYPQLSVFDYADAGALAGRTLEQAECRFTLWVQPQTDGRVQLELLPELHYGEARTRPTTRPELGIVYFEPTRERIAYSDMQLSALLAPGEILVLGARDDRPGSLGHHFFTSSPDTGERREQKLLLVRLSQTQLDAATALELLDESATDSTAR